MVMNFIKVNNVLSCISREPHKHKYTPIIVAHIRNDNKKGRGPVIVDTVLVTLYQCCSVTLCSC